MAVSRREFLGASAAAAAAMLGASWAESVFAQDTADIRIAVIGFNGQGNGHIEASHRNIVALCDVDEARARRTRPRRWPKSTARKSTRSPTSASCWSGTISTACRSPRRTTCTPGCRARRPRRASMCMCEKPASHNIWEGRQMVAAARQYNRMMQCGTQSRSSPSLKEAVGVGAGRRARQNPVRSRHVLQAAAEHRQARQAAGDSRARFITTCGAARRRRTICIGRSCTTIGIGIGTRATATWATRASIRWISPAGSSASRRSRRG